MEKIEYKDMFGIYYRVKQIRPTYKLLLNRKTNKVELFDCLYNQTQLIFDLPIYPNILQKIKYTMVENANKIFRDVELKNRIFEEKNMQNAIYSAKNLIQQY